ncbi:cell envelope integrity EipB family protein [Hyphomicrobium sp. D-2]|uniref:cell envelope integrity EipB family protein n=1 Tax=Hyphomicrobium sp. D-2 TaxID=3041621 RepID=UPI002455D8F0|nr:cell envelope integrity EipB family protein [Hyphomicrobium sp. D-2]MDH4982728.1 cell envelope integrity EipB family protein [Hyphomicrobium sp. D-2]
MFHLAKVLVAGALGVAAMAAPLGDLQAQVAGSAVQFRPHRAVYDITFDHATPGSGVADMVGRMVYEMAGSDCGEYAQSMRFVTRMTNQDGVSQVNDLRTNSFENVPNHVLRFSSSQYENEKQSEAAQGTASAGGDGTFTEVKLTKPKKKTVKLPASVYFPIQHSLALVEAARKGQTQFTANLFDGSDKGEKFYETSAVIGAKLAAGSQPVPVSLKNGGELNAIPSWPIAIGYFEPGMSRQDILPTYELSFRFFENGVSSGLYIDYGDFAIRGELKELTFLDSAKCGSPSVGGSSKR